MAARCAVSSVSRSRSSRGRPAGSFDPPRPLRPRAAWCSCSPTASVGERGGADAGARAARVRRPLVRRRVRSRPGAGRRARGASRRRDPLDRCRLPGPGRDGRGCGHPPGPPSRCRGVEPAPSRAPSASGPSPLVSRSGCASRPGPFLLVVALGGEPGPTPGLAPPATIAGRLAPPLPRIAIADLGFSARPGGEERPPAWSEPARQRAAAAHLERSLVADGELASLGTLVARAAPGAALVVVGDPPPDRGAHGLLTRRDALFDETLRSALVVTTPGLEYPGQASSRLVSTLDAAPTLLALAGLAAEPGLPGRSLMPLLADPGGEGRPEAVSSVERRAGRVGRSARISALALHGVARRQPRALRPRRGPRGVHEPRLAARWAGDHRGDGSCARVEAAPRREPGRGRVSATERAPDPRRRPEHPSRRAGALP